MILLGLFSGFTNEEGGEDRHSAAGGVSPALLKSQGDARRLAPPQREETGFRNRDFVQASPVIEARAREVPSWIIIPQSVRRLVRSVRGRGKLRDSEIPRGVS